MPHCRCRPTINRRWPIVCGVKWNGCVEGPKARTTKAKGPHSVGRQTHRGTRPGRGQGRAVHHWHRLCRPRGESRNNCWSRKRSRKRFSEGPSSRTWICSSVLVNAWEPPRARTAAAKTTLLRLLAGTLEPDSEHDCARRGLRIVSFEQHRESLDQDAPLRRALAPSGGDAVVYQSRSVHLASWAKRFLFRPEQLDLPVSRLSGGEQARLLIAQLMLQPADLLILDEPTNDLDIPTLDVLEDSLLEFPGALVLVTHDRWLLDRVSTILLALDGTGRLEWFADYAQWESAQEPGCRVGNRPKAKKAAPPPRPTRGGGCDASQAQETQLS